MDKKNLILANSDHSKKKKESSKGAHVKVDPSKKRHLSASQDKFSTLKKKSANTAQSTKINKREFVLKFVKDSSSIIWPKEMKMVNMLFKIAPNDDFWRSLDLKFKLNSLCWFLSDDGRKFLNTEYKKFNFEPNKPEVYNIEQNNNIEFKGKIGETVQAPMTVREFLTLWQKKN